jgi:small subunit ribosomal protein S21
MFRAVSLFASTRPAQAPQRKWANRGVRPIVQVIVRDNNVDQALKALKKKMQREGLFREMKLRRSYEKPSERKARDRPVRAPFRLMHAPPSLPRQRTALACAAR